jgi:hypothetical protein
VPTVDPDVHAQRRTVVNPFCPLTKPTFTTVILYSSRLNLHRFVDTVAPYRYDQGAKKCTDTDKGALKTTG